MTASEIRALFSVASRPEVVSLAGGMPNISGLPLDVVGGAISDLVRTSTARSRCSTAPARATRVLREQICDVMRLEGIEAHPDDVVVTVGSQQAVDLVTRIFCDPGDVVICEAPSYVGALGVFRAYECDVVHVEMDDARAGARRRCARRSRRCRRPGRRIKFVYTIPNYHNPAGVTLSRRAPPGGPRDLPRGRRAGPRGQPLRPARLRRRAAPRAARRRGGRRDLPRLVLQDVRARASGSAGRWRRTRSARSSCWPRSRRRCARRRSARWRSRRTSRPHDWQGQVKQFREMYRERRDAMVEALDDLMPAAARWNVPDGGFYVWLTLPRRARRQGDAAACGDRPGRLRARAPRSSPTASAARSMRLSYCYPTPERIREGVRRLVGVIEEELELRAHLRHRRPRSTARRAATKRRTPT